MSCLHAHYVYVHNRVFALEFATLFFSFINGFHTFLLRQNSALFDGFDETDAERSQEKRFEERNLSNLQNGNDEVDEGSRCW